MNDNMTANENSLEIVVAFNVAATSGREQNLDYISEVAVENEAEIVHQSIRKLGHNSVYLPVKDIESVFSFLKNANPDLIFNLCEGFQGHAKLEMNLAALWELMGIRFTGNSALTLGLALNKVLAKQVLQSVKILTPEYEVHQRVPENTYLNFPVIAKPSREDASLGITANAVVHHLNELQNSISRLLEKYQQPILVEQYIHGREFNVSILHDGSPRVLPISEISFANMPEGLPHITSYEAKWLPEHPIYQKTPAICPAAIEPDLRQRLEDTALKVFQVLGGRDYGRVDTRVDAVGNVYVLEFNPNPDISADGGYVKALHAAGIKYKEFIAKLIYQTMNRKPHE
jgi:D-alanine-D-alanine ligase